MVIIFLTCLINAFSQNVWDIVEANLHKYVELTKRKKFDEATTLLKETSRLATNADDRDVSKANKLLVQYLHARDLLKRKESKKDLSLAFYYAHWKLVDFYGDNSPLVWAINEDVCLQLAKVTRGVDYKIIYLLQAEMIMNHLDGIGIDNIEVPHAVQVLFRSADAEITSASAARMGLEIKDSINNITQEQCFHSVCRAVDIKDVKLRPEIVNRMFGILRVLGHRDVDAVEGFVYETGSLGVTDHNKADSLYKSASENGSVWGAMQHAYHLCEAGEYKKASSILARYRNEPNFANEGGNYLLGRVAESGVVKGEGLQEALGYYTQNEKKCRWRKWSKDGTARIRSIEQGNVENEVSTLLADRGGEGKCTARELAGIAEIYERVKDEENGNRFRKLAAEKGHVRSACIYAASYYKNNYEKKADMIHIGKLLLGMEDEEYLPMVYNLGVIYCMGYGVERDLVKAKEYLDRYLELAQEENMDDYEVREYIPVLGLTARIKEGLPLNNAIIIQRRKG